MFTNTIIIVLFAKLKQVYIRSGCKKSFSTDEVSLVI